MSALNTEGHPLLGTSLTGNSFNVAGYARFIIHVPATSAKILFDAIGLDSWWVNSQPGDEYVHWSSNMNPTGSSWEQGDDCIEGPPDGVTMESGYWLNGENVAPSYYSFATSGASTLTVHTKP